MVFFTNKFRTLDPHLPIVWDKVLKKTFFLTPSPGPVSTPSSYCVGYSVIKDTTSSYFTNYTMWTVCTVYRVLDEGSHDLKVLTIYNKSNSDHRLLIAVEKGKIYHSLH